MNHQQQPATAVSIKASLVATNENRLIALPSPPSFDLLVEKISAVFNLSTNEVAVRVHYVDDESDRVTVSSNDELACALSLLPSGRPLRLFVSTTAVGAAAQLAAAKPTHEEQNQSTDVQPITTGDSGHQPADVGLIKAEDGGEAAIDALKRRLFEQGIEVCEKRCMRVLAKFGGDVDKAHAALERCHERKQMGLAAGTAHRKCPESDKLEALRQQGEDRRAERLATRLARQEQKKQAATDINEEGAGQKKVYAASAEALVARMAELGLIVGTGRCTGALRRADGDIDAAKADLVAWCARRQVQKRNKPEGKTTSAPIDDADQGKLLDQLDQMGFGGLSGSDDKAAERIKRRNERLLKRCNGDVAQAVGLLEARKAKVEARVAARKALQGERRTVAPSCKRTAHRTEELFAKAPTAC